VNNISSYFESKGQITLAGKYIMYSGNYEKALKLFIRSAAMDPNAIDLAISAVGQAKVDNLTHQLIDFLMGEVDGIPKDAKYIFKLYMSLGQYKEAARTAIIVAREEQALGNYRAAHDLLLENYMQLRAVNGQIPAEIDRMLMLIHSYILVKVRLIHLMVRFWFVKRIITRVLECWCESHQTFLNFLPI
jgi:WD repeat-containing protein 19